MCLMQLPFTNTRIRPLFSAQDTPGQRASLLCQGWYLSLVERLRCWCRFRNISLKKHNRLRSAS